MEMAQHTAIQRLKMAARRVLAVFLVFVVVFTLTLGNAEAAKTKTKKPPTYTADQIALIQTYAADLAAMRDRMGELDELIKAKDWIYARNFIHGPYGELRTTMLNVARNLLPNDQPEAKQLAKSVFDDLVAIDLAGQQRDAAAATKGFNKAVRDFDAFLALIPKG
jgi:photosystem II protein PsbQ